MVPLPAGLRFSLFVALFFVEPMGQIVEKVLHLSGHLQLKLNIRLKLLPLLVYEVGRDADIYVVGIISDVPRLRLY